MKINLTEGLKAPGVYADNYEYHRQNAGDVDAAHLTGQQAFHLIRADVFAMLFNRSIPKAMIHSVVKPLPVSGRFDRSELAKLIGKVVDGGSLDE